jgi:hypothetical protein
MTTSDHRHSNLRNEANNGHHPNDNTHAGDVEVDSGISKKRKCLILCLFYFLCFYSNRISRIRNSFE